MEKEIQNKSGWFAKGGVLAGVFAFIGASCCILPIILINLGLSSAIVSHLGFLARMRPWFLGLTIILIIAGFIYAFRGGKRPPRRILTFLILATLLAIGAYILPYFEGDLQRWLNLTNR